MSISYHNELCGYKYKKYNITTLRQYIVIILINSYFSITEFVPDNL